MDIPSALQGLKALIARDSLLSRISEISVPCLVMVGQEDSSLPTSRSKLIHEGIKNSEYVEIPGAGHLSALEQPEQVNAAMGSFLDRL